MDGVFTQETLKTEHRFCGRPDGGKNLSSCKAAFPCSRIKGVSGSLPMFQYLHTVLDQILTSLIAVDLCV